MAHGDLLPPPNVNGGGRASEISLTRISLPFAMVLTFGGFLVVAGYTVGGVMSGMARDKREVEQRLGAIEREITSIKSILSDRSQAPAPPTPCRCK